MQAGKDEVRVDVSSADYSRCLLRKQNGYWSAIFLWHLRQTPFWPDAEKTYRDQYMSSELSDVWQGEY